MGNELKTIINLLFYAANEEGQLQLVEVLASDVAKGAFSLRGFDDQERRFAVMVKIGGIIIQIQFQVTSHHVLNNSFPKLDTNGLNCLKIILLILEAIGSGRKCLMMLPE